MKEDVKIFELYDEVKSVCSELLEVAVFKFYNKTPVVRLDFSKITAKEWSEVDDIMSKKGFKFEKIIAGRYGHSIALIYVGDDINEGDTN